MTFSIVHRNGSFESEPTVEMFSSLYDERYIEDDEHLEVSVGHESGWYLSLYSGGRLVWENVEKLDNQPKYMNDAPKEKVIELWMKLANGEIDAIEAESWIIGYE